MKKMHRLALLALILGAVFMIAGCEGPMGPAGEAGATGAAGADGADGLPGPTLYLTDSNGVRIYSGGSYYLGKTPDESNSVTTVLNLVNDTSAALTLSGTPVVELVVTTNIFYTGESYSNVDNGEIAEDFSGVASSLATGASSGDMIFVLDYKDAKCEVRKRYRILMDDGVDEYNFVFEVYGFVVTSAG